MTPIDPRHLRSMVEFAVTIAREGQKIKPPLTFPAALRRHFAGARIPGTALAGLVRAIDADAGFRARIAPGAIPELVDEIGQLWLRRPDGWEQQLVALVAGREQAETDADLSARLQRADRRRQAAELALTRAQAEVASLLDRIAERDAVIEALRSDAVKLSDSVDELRAQLADTRLEARHARDREAAAQARVDAATAARDAALVARGDAEAIRDEALATRAELSAERSELARLAATASAVALQLAQLADPPAPGAPKPVRRTPLALPGGVAGSSVGAAEFLFRSGASILVDGYNVAKLAWPALDLEGQRVVLLDAVENLAKRYGSDITVVFDGADLTGRSADRRRIVRVLFSSDEAIADDVLRDEVRRLPASRPVVIVTNDRQVVKDVRALGANTLASEQLLALIR